MVKRSLIKAAVTLMLAAMLFNMLAFSAAAASIDVNDVTASRGDTVTFTATLSESVTIGSAAVEVAFDENVLEYANGDGSGAWNAPEAILSAFFSSAGNGALAYMEAASVSGDIFTITLKVKDDAPVGATDVKLNITLKDENNNTIDLTNNCGKLIVTSESADGAEAPGADLAVIIAVACGGVLVAAIIVVLVRKKTKN